MAIPVTWSKTGWRQDYSEDRGFTITETYRGPAGANKATFALFLAEFSGYIGSSFEGTLPQTDDEGPVSGTITWASNEAGERIEPGGVNDGLLTRTWNLLGSDEELPMEQHPNVDALLNYNQDWPARIRGIVDGYQKKTKDFLESWDWPPNTPPAIDEWDPRWVHLDGASATLNGYAGTYASLLLKLENPTYQAAKYVLRKTETVTSWSTLVVSHTNVNRWLRWATLTASEPTLASTGLIQTSGLTGFIWLKKAPEVTVSSNGTRELTQEFWGGIIPATGSVARTQLEFIFGAIL